MVESAIPNGWVRVSESHGGRETPQHGGPRQPAPRDTGVRPRLLRS
jgi:hypothetical protein